MDLGQDARVVRDGDRIRGSAWCESEASCGAVEGYVHPDAHGRRIGRLIATELEEAARHGARRIQNGAFEADSAASGLLKSLGYGAVRVFREMRVDSRRRRPQPSGRTGHPMVRQARQMIADGELGPLRVVQVEYAQDWLSTPLEKTGQKQALWRTDPALSGPGGSLGDIGTHAFNLASFVTGLNCRELAAELTTFVPGRRVDDNVQIMLRFAEGARGLLWASQVASGNQNNLRLRVFGEKAGIEWRQEDPNYLWFAPLGKTPVVISRAGPGASPVAAHASRIPSGHAEGYLEAFAQLYTDMAEQISARIDGRAADPSSLLVPTVEDGVQGMRFIAAVIESSRQNAAWTPLPAAG